MEDQQQRHQFGLVWVKGKGYHNRCRVCQWTWPTRRQSACPGVPRYAYGAWPSTLHPAGELLRLGREIPPKADGCAYQLREPHWLWLYYDEREIAPFAYSPPPKQTLRARLRAFFKKEEDDYDYTWYTRCQICGYTPSDPYAGLIDEGLCRTCRFQRDWGREIQDIRHWAQRVLQDEHAILLDTETTGLQKHDEVIELALLSTSDRRLLYHSLIRPSQPISWERSLRYVPDKQRRSAPTFGEAWRDVLPILESSSTIISYNADFHRVRLAWTARQYGYQLPPLRWECLMTRYAVFYAKPRSITRPGSFGYQTLNNACRQQHTTGSLMHDASEHVKAARRLLRALAEKEGQHWDAIR